MKKSLLILALLLPMLVLAQSIHHSVSFKSDALKVDLVEVEGKTYTIPQYDDLQSSGLEIGEPMLPQKFISFAVPLEATDINLTNVANESGSEYNLTYPVKPEPEPTIAGSTNPIKEEFELKDFVESNIVKISHVENYKCISKIVTVCVTPTLYDSKDGKLTLLTNISFDINYRKDNNIVNNVLYKRTNNYYYSKYYIEDLNFVKSNVVNAESIVIPEITEEQAATVQTHTSGEYGDAYEYTIVTKRSFGNAFQRLVTLKRMQGLDAGIVYIEDILSNSSFTSDPYNEDITDDAAKLKAYLIANKDVIRYVLLSGKPPIIPVRYGYKNYPDSMPYRIIPSDLYYGTGPDSNWYHNYNGTYGTWSRGFTYSSFFQIGRLLCKSADEINNYLDKLEIYQINPGFGDYNYLQNSYTHLSNGISVNYRNNRQLLFNSIESNFSLSEVSDGVDSIHTGKKVIDDINSAHYGFLNLHGHGNPGGISTHDGSSTNALCALDEESAFIISENGNGLNNLDNFGYPNIIYAGSCNTAAFESPRFQGFGECFQSYDDSLSVNMAESFTTGKNYGGPAYIGNTRLIYMRNCPQLSILFFDALNFETTKRRVGDALFNSICLHNINFSDILHGDDHGDYIGHALVGDPALEIWKGTELPTCVSDLIENQNNDGQLRGTVIHSNGNVSFSVNLNGNLTPSNLTNTSNGVIYLTHPNSTPYIGDLNISGSQLLTNPVYFYAKKAKIGNVSNNPLQKIRINSSAKLTIDASENIDILYNVELLSGAKITVMTPDTCRVGNVTFGSNSKLIIYAGVVIGGEHNPYIEIHPYDKYGTGNNQSSPQQIASRNVDEYKPLLTPGKEWKYSIVSTNSWTGDIVGLKKGYIKVDVPINKDNLEYYPVHFGWDTEDEYVLLREDVNNKKVWMALDTPDDSDNYMLALHEYCYLFDEIALKGEELKPEYILYDFNNLKDCLATYNMDETGSVEIETMYGTVTATKFTNKLFSSSFVFIEGIGIISLYDYFDPAYCLSDLFGQLNGGELWGDAVPYPYLYEVVDGDDTVLYYDESKTPGMVGLKTIGVDGDASVHVTGNAINVSAKSGDNTLTIYSIDGKEIMKRKIGARATITTDGIPTGIYFVKVGSTTKKIRI